MPIRGCRSRARSHFLQQFLLMQRGPFKDETLRPRREIASHPTGCNLHGDPVFTVHSVKVRQAMLAVEHPDDDTEEPRNLRHFVGEGHGDDGE